MVTTASNPKTNSILLSAAVNLKFHHYAYTHTYSNCDLNTKI